MCTLKSEPAAALRQMAAKHADQIALLQRRAISTLVLSAARLDHHNCEPETQTTRPIR